MISKIILFSMVSFYLFAGINHFIKPNFYVSIMPNWFPMPNLLNQISGIAEIILAIGLLFNQTRKISAYLIIAMLISFFAVHISHLFLPPKVFGTNGKTIALIRIPFQFIFIYWAYFVSKLNF